MSMGGGGTQTSTSTQAIDPQIKSLIMENVQGAKDIAGQGFTPYGGPLTSGLNFNQMTAGDRAFNLNQAGAGAVNGAVGGAQSLLGFNPQSITDPNAAAGMAQWQNPYTSDVINSSLSDLERQRKIQQASDMDSVAKAGAFGNNRVGVMQANTNEAYDRTGADLIANLRNTGFNTAAGLAQQDASRNVGVQQANQNAGIAGAGIRQGASGLLGQLGGQQQQMEQAGINALLGYGNLQQQSQQAGLDAQYQEFLRQINQPYTGQSLINQSLGLLPQSGTTTQTGPKPDQTAGMLGGIGTLLGGIGLLSDFRCKDDIATVGYDDAGRRWTTWRYKWEPVDVRHFGLIAQEAMETDPDAVFEAEDGFLRIDYSKLTVH